MDPKVDILKPSVVEQSERLEQRLDGTTEWKLFPEGFSASNAAGELTEVRVSDD